MFGLSFVFLVSCKKTLPSGAENSSYQNVSLSNAVVLDRRIFPLKDSGYIGITDVNFGKYVDIRVQKFNRNNKLIWEITFGSPFDEKINAVKESETGDILLGGWSKGFVQNKDSLHSHNGSASYIVLLDKNGNLKWQKKIIPFLAI